MQTRVDSVSGEAAESGGDRPTRLGPFSLAQPGTSRSRVVPVPWIDCSVCSWRHYPSTAGGRWHIATTCVSCGAPLDLEHALPDAPA